MFMKGNFRQQVTYWAPLAGDDGYGGGNLALPVVLKARWEDSREFVMDSKGQQIVSKAEVYVAQDQQFEIDGWLFLGISALTNPRTLSGAYQIVSVMRVPDLRNLTAEVCAIL